MTRQYKKMYFLAALFSLQIIAFVSSSNSYRKAPISTVSSFRSQRTHQIQVFMQVFWPLHHYFLFSFLSFLFLTFLSPLLFFYHLPAKLPEDLEINKNVFCNILQTHILAILATCKVEAYISLKFTLSSLAQYQHKMNDIYMSRFESARKI